MTGFSGGIRVLWDNEDVLLSLEYVYRFFIHVRVRAVGGMEWALTAVYASPNPSIRRLLWERLDWSEVSFLWVLVGDFNCVLQADERSTKKGEPSSF